MNNILQCTLIKQVNKICLGSCGEKFREKICHVVCYNPKCRTVDAFLAIIFSDLKDDISMLCLLIVLKYRFFGVYILIFKKNELEFDVTLIPRGVISKIMYLIHYIHADHVSS